MNKSRIRILKLSNRLESLSKRKDSQKLHVLSNIVFLLAIQPFKTWSKDRLRTLFQKTFPNLVNRRIDRNFPDIKVRHFMMLKTLGIYSKRQLRKYFLEENPDDRFYKSLKRAELI